MNMNRLSLRLEKALDQYRLTVPEKVIKHTHRDYFALC